MKTSLKAGLAFTAAVLSGPAWGQNAPDKKDWSPLTQPLTCLSLDNKHVYAVYKGSGDKSNVLLSFERFKDSAIVTPIVDKAGHFVGITSRSGEKIMGRPVIPVPQADPAMPNKAVLKDWEALCNE